MTLGKIHLSSRAATVAPANWAYFLVIPEMTAAAPAVEAFRSWILAEAAQAKGAANLSRRAS